MKQTGPSSVPVPPPAGAASAKERRLELKQRRRALKARLKGHVPGREHPWRKRALHAAIAIVLLLLLLLLHCDCGTAHLEAKKPAQPAQVKKPANKPEQPKKKMARLKGDLDRQHRAGLHTETAGPPSWLEDFRLQVTARSPRLASCFAGTDRPGALRWTTTVNPVDGNVSQHQFEGLGSPADLTGEQRACLVQALTRPRYKLTHAEQETSTKQVSLVLEF